MRACAQGERARDSQFATENRFLQLSERVISLRASPISLFLSLPLFLFPSLSFSPSDFLFQQKEREREQEEKARATSSGGLRGPSKSSREHPDDRVDISRRTWRDSRPTDRLRKEDRNGDNGTEPRRECFRNGRIQFHRRLANRSMLIARICFLTIHSIRTERL